jgi:hypothetical protein
MGSRCFLLFDLFRGATLERIVEVQTKKDLYFAVKSNENDKEKRKLSEVLSRSGCYD